LNYEEERGLYCLGHPSRCGRLPCGFTRTAA